MDIDIILLILIISGGLFYWYKNKRPQSTQYLNAINNKAVDSESIETIVIAETSEVEVITAIPEDSMLRRHFLANIEAERLSIKNPYPTEVVVEAPTIEETPILESSTVTEKRQVKKHQKISKHRKSK